MAFCTKFLQFFLHIYKLHKVCPRPSFLPFNGYFLPYFMRFYLLFPNSVNIQCESASIYMNETQIDFDVWPPSHGPVQAKKHPVLRTRCSLYFYLQFRRISFGLCETASSLPASLASQVGVFQSKPNLILPIRFPLENFPSGKFSRVRWVSCN